MFVGNDNAVQNGPTVATTFQVARRSKLLFLMTYHWNYGNGKMPGQIGLQRGDRKASWHAAGSPTSGKNTNVYWEIKPDVTLDPGVYTVLDSDPSTWSCNSQSGGQGHAVVKLVEVGTDEPNQPAPSPQPTATRQESGSSSSDNFMVGDWTLYDKVKVGGGPRFITMKWVYIFKPKGTIAFKVNPTHNTGWWVRQGNKVRITNTKGDQVYTLSADGQYLLNDNGEVQYARGCRAN